MLPIALVLPVLTLQEPAPLTIQFNVFEVPTSLRLSGKWIATQKSAAATTRVIVGAKQPTEESLHQMAKKGTARLVTAPAVRTLSGMEGQMVTRVDCDEGESTEQTIKVVPTVLPDGTIKIALDATLGAPSAAARATFTVREDTSAYVIAPMKGAKDRQMLVAIRVSRG